MTLSHPRSPHRLTGEDGDSDGWFVSNRLKRWEWPRKFRDSVTEEVALEHLT